MSLAFLRDMRRPAPWEAELRLCGLPRPRTTNAGSAIVPGITPSTPGAGRRRAFAMDDQLAALMPFLPGEVVMVLDAGDDLRAQQLRHQPMDHRVIRRRVFAHEVHRLPILLAGFAVEARATPAGRGLCSACGNAAWAIWLYVLHTAAPAPRLPLWLKQRDVLAGRRGRAACHPAASDSTPNSTK